MKTIYDERTDSGHITVKADIGSSTEEHEANLSVRQAEKMLERGVTEFNSHYRGTKHFGRFLRYKEVGPPPWKLPHVYVDTSRKPFAIRFGVGWRSTLYGFIWMAKNRKD